MKTTVTHEQRWHLNIERTPDDQWPDSLPNPHALTLMRPDCIRASIDTRGQIDFTVYGRRVLKDGTLGTQLRSRYYNAPSWAKDLVRETIRASDEIPVEPK